MGASSGGLAAVFFGVEILYSFYEVHSDIVVRVSRALRWEARVSVGLMMNVSTNAHI